MQLLPEVIKVLRKARDQHSFSRTRAPRLNSGSTRSMQAVPEWRGQIGLHHGSLSGEVRAEAEEGLRTGSFRAVVATSSLDLGVDFAPVDAVFQGGQPERRRPAPPAGRPQRTPPRRGEPRLAVSRPIHSNSSKSPRLAISPPQGKSRTALPRLTARCSLPAHGHASPPGGMDETGGFDPIALRRRFPQQTPTSHLSDEEWAWALNFAARAAPRCTPTRNSPA